MGNVLDESRRATGIVLISSHGDFLVVINSITASDPVRASTDGRRLVASQMDKVVLVDLEFKDSPRDDRQPVFGHLRR